MQNNITILPIFYNYATISACGLMQHVFYLMVVSVEICFQVDYNLYGMGHIHVKDFKFRPPLPDDFHLKSSLRRKVYCFTVLELRQVI